MTTTVPAPGRPRERVVTARTAVFVVFALAGVVFASWAARIADTKIALGLSAGELGVTLLAASAGSVTGLPLAGRVVDRVGAARAVLGGWPSRSPACSRRRWSSTPRARATSSWSVSTSSASVSACGTSR
ncbi:hypothetical protein [Phycicoccus endophyticus]|uniref:hypothetical protein n=1 Tax=Phycicoccus endophyticus TaxID=1690220 RepID=UPI0030B83065